MAVRNKPSLSEILTAFKKTAGMEEMQPQQGMPMQDPAMMQPDPSMMQQGMDPAMMQQGMQPDPSMMQGMQPEESDGPAELAEAAALLEQASQQAEALKGAVPEADQRVVDAAAALKNVADEFIEEHTESLAKEAALFGQLFAASCMQEMNKTAALQGATEEAYAVAANALNGAYQEDGMNKLAQVYDEAWRSTMAKIAGFEDDDEMEEAAGRELDAEDIAEIVDAVREEDEDVELSDEEIADLAEQLAEAEGDEPSIEEVAEAANLLSDLREDKDDECEYCDEEDEEEVLPKVAFENYYAVLDELGY